MLALWEFFWTRADWVPGPPPVIPPPVVDVAVPTSKGSGASRHKVRGDYTAADSDFWQLRERYLRRHLPQLDTLAGPLDVAVPIDEQAAIEKSNLPVVAPVSTVEGPAPGGAVISLQQQLSSALHAARTANNAVQLRTAIAVATQLALDISDKRTQYYNRAIALLLLDVF